MKNILIIFLIVVLLTSLSGCANIANYFKNKYIDAGNLNTHEEDLIQDEEDEAILEDEEPEDDESEEPSQIEQGNNDEEQKIEDSEEHEKDLEEQTPTEDDGVIKIFSDEVPDDLIIDLKYDNYPINFNYLLVTTSSSIANVRERPSLKADVILTVKTNDKLSLVREMEDEDSDSSSWYEVTWTEQDNTCIGYISSKLCEPRIFQLQKMLDQIKLLSFELEKGNNAYIDNYKNAKGLAPLHNGNTNDEFGYRRSQSAPGYIQPDPNSNFRYIPDGMLVQTIDNLGEYTKVWVVGFSEECWVPSKYISKMNSIDELIKAVVVDRKNQNEAVFEYRDGEWILVSYSLATTGKKGAYSLETPLGNYMAIAKLSKFVYYKDGTKVIDGYAPYAIRFSGGGYIHGVPVRYIIRDDKRIDPGKKEYLHTIGTVPLSHMCVRNFTSHAKFIYEWIEIGKSAVIIIE